jgi:hypothetical protein
MVVAKFQNQKSSSKKSSSEIIRTPNISAFFILLVWLEDLQEDLQTSNSHSLVTDAKTICFFSSSGSLKPERQILFFFDCLFSFF